MPVVPSPIKIAARVVICDDSTFTRVALGKILNGFGVDVVRECRNGAEALQAARELKPDLIIMDIEMPVMNGLEATRRIMQEVPTRVLILSGAARTGRVEAIKAMRAGAVDVMTKPEAADLATLREELRVKVTTALQATVAAGSQPRESMRTAPVVPATGTRVTQVSDRTPAPQPALDRPARFDPKRQLKLDVIAIGTSTGGPGTLARILSTLPSGYKLPILIVQHMPAGWTETLAEQLASCCALPVREAKDGEFAEPGTVFIAPGDRHLELSPARRLSVHDGPLDGGFRPAANTLFRSVARYTRGRCLAVVLTGMGQDGMEGARAVRDAGGVVLAESRETCILYGMPRAVVEAGLASAVLPLPEIGQYLVRQGS